MIVRSLRWRLVIAMALLIAAVVVVVGLFSSMTVKREFNRFLVEQHRVDRDTAEDVVRRAPDVQSGIRQVHERFGIRSLVFDEKRKIIASYPPSMHEYRVAFHPNGGLELRRGFETILLKGAGRTIAGKGTVVFLPPEEKDLPAPRSFRVSVDRGLLAGLAASTLLAVLVMVTIFRRVFAPVEALTRGARALAEGRLDVRVDVRGRDEVAELGRAFNGMAEALERTERVRKNMVTDVAHELRTPLTSIRVQVEGVQDGVLEADAKWLSSIEEDAATLACLIDDLQELALADAGQLRLERIDIAVAELVERAVSGLPLNGLALSREVPTDLSVHVDARRIVQVLRNLLVNATTYAKSTITVRASHAGDRVEIRVADDGAGVPDEHAERIFDRFHRADPSRSRTTGGAGLGLAIAKQLVELHGGSICYERPAFVIVLPGAE